MDARAWNLRFQVFRSCAELCTKQRDDDFKYAGMILIRSTIGDAEPDYAGREYPAMDTVFDFEHLLFKGLEYLHIPDKYLLLLLQDLMHQLVVFSTNLFGRDPHHSYVIFLVIQIKGEDDLTDDHFVKNMTAGEAKEALLVYPDIHVRRKSRRMNEVKAVVKRCRRDDLDVQIECPICLQEMDFGDEYVQTPCKHVYHAGCLGRWLLSTYKPVMSDEYSNVQFPACPMCRQYLLA